MGLHPGSGRSMTLLEVKRFFDAAGARFNLGTGLSDTERRAPPEIGATITFRYQELTEADVPRSTSFLRVRRDL